MLGNVLCIGTCLANDKEFWKKRKTYSLGKSSCCHTIQRHSHLRPWSTSWKLLGSSYQRTTCSPITSSLPLTQIPSHSYLKCEADRSERQDVSVPGNRTWVGTGSLPCSLWKRAVLLPQTLLNLGSVHTRKFSSGQTVKSQSPCSPDCLSVPVTTPELLSPEVKLARPPWPHRGLDYWIAEGMTRPLVILSSFPRSGEGFTLGHPINNTALLWDNPAGLKDVNVTTEERLTIFKKWESVSKYDICVLK